MDKSFLYEYAEIVDELCIEISVSVSRKEANVRAVIDTGTTHSFISRRLINELSPISANTRVMIYRKPSDGYFFNIHLSDGLMLNNFILYEMPYGFDDDFLLGMDVVSQGDLAISNYDGQTAVSFRKPSKQRISFLEIADAVDA